MSLWLLVGLIKKLNHDSFIQLDTKMVGEKAIGIALKP